MRFLRYLRIAFSAACLIACVLLIVLWIHSYKYQDYYVGWVSKSRSIGSLFENGWINIDSTWFDTNKLDESEVGQLPGWEATSNLIEADPLFGSPVGTPRKWRWATLNGRNNSHLQVWFPCWFPVLITAVVGSLPWIGKLGQIRHLNRRFSLRTLLIVTTLVAVVLGLIVWPR